MRSASWRGRITALSLVAVGAVVVTACSSTNSATSATTSSGSSGASSSIPQSAFSDRTGITSTTVHVANVSTLTGGLFKGAAVGTQAYADYANSTGGVKGRTIVVDSGDDLFQGATNTQLTTSALTNDFALVGSFSLEDQFGGIVLKRNPGMPDVSVTLDQTTLHLPNVYSAAPASGGWQEGSLQYFKSKYPQRHHRGGRAGRRRALLRGGLGRREVRHGARSATRSSTTTPSPSPRPTSPRT